MVDVADVLDAGDFGAWLRRMESALDGGPEPDVPCGTCTGCCTSSQFVHIAAGEADAIAHIPADLLFDAPGMPPGTKILGYDQHGRCPMLGDHGCTIYEHRPITCRTYDCRVFPAAGLEPDEVTKTAIARQVRRWQFRHATPDDRVRHDAVRAAATVLAERDALPPGAPPPTATQRAVLAVEVHRLFVTEGDAGTLRLEPAEPRAVQVELLRRRPARSQR